jgi:hypothetical protein
LITFLAISVHLLFDAAAGWSLLGPRTKEDSGGERLVFSVLVGMYLETVSIATVTFLGVSLNAALAIVGGLMLAAISVALYRRGFLGPKLAGGRPTFYEWALIAAVGERILFGLWQLNRMPTYFQDALMHWSGRARALYGGVNWSFDSTSPLFMGAYNGNNNYPLNLVLWRAATAKLNGEWNEVISRADGLIFFLAIVATLWLAVRRISRQRWLAAVAAFTAAAVPLHAWHVAAGYSDIAVEAFCVACVAAILGRRWFWAGLLAAGAAWTKNDALLMYLPGLLLAAIVMRQRWRDTAEFLLGLMTIIPWLLFNVIHHLGVTPVGSQVAWHPGALLLFWQALMASPTSQILWIGLLAGILCTFRRIGSDRTARALALVFLFPMAAILFTFTSTGAYEFLRNGTTINRSLMQFSSMAILVAAYGVSRLANDPESPIPGILSSKNKKPAGRQIKQKSNPRSWARP